MDFNNHIVAIWNIGGAKIVFTETMRNSLVVSTILVIFAIAARKCLNNFEAVPKGFQNLLELIVEMFSGLTESALGKKYSYFGNWYFTVFAFILVSNYSGMLGLRPPTADLATTFSLGLVTFFLIHITGIRVNKGGYFKGYLEPLAPFLPLNILSALSTPVSVSFRLFGNILGGTIIMGLIYTLPFYVKIGIPAVLHFYFDIFSGAIQALIFTMLGLLFIGEQIPESDKL